MLSELCGNALFDMRDNILLAQEFARGHDLQSFAADVKSCYAVMRAVEIVSEASRRLHDDVRDRRPHLPRRDIRDAGNFYRHQYDNVKESYVWRTVHEYLPPLLVAVVAEIEGLDTHP
jgi:uncharacterized protein with HEPN domain